MVPSYWFAVNTCILEYLVQICIKVKFTSLVIKKMWLTGKFWDHNPISGSSYQAHLLFNKTKVWSSHCDFLQAGWHPCLKSQRVCGKEVAGKTASQISHLPNCRGNGPPNLFDPFLDTLNTLFYYQGHLRYRKVLLVLKSGVRGAGNVSTEKAKMFFWIIHDDKILRK